MKKSQEISISMSEYRQFIEHLKARVLSARLSAARAVNQDLILLYWDIGRGIAEKQQTLGWGESVVEMVASDLQQAFPATTGFSPRNLRNAKQLYLSYSDPTIWLQAVAKLPRGAKAGEIEIWPQVVAKLTKERAADDRPSMGIILCAEKDDVEVEYALRTKTNPIGVAVYQLQTKLPAALKGKLPTAQQLAGVVRTILPERSGS